MFCTSVLDGWHTLVGPQVKLFIWKFRGLKKKHHRLKKILHWLEWGLRWFQCRLIRIRLVLLFVLMLGHWKRSGFLRLSVGWSVRYEVQSNTEWMRADVYHVGEFIESDFPRFAWLVVVLDLLERPGERCLAQVLVRSIVLFVVLCLCSNKISPWQCF